MNSLFRPRRTPLIRRHPSCECLESRCVLSALIPVSNITLESPLAVQGLSIEPFNQLGLNPANLEQQVSDPGELALLTNPTQPVQALVLTFNQAFPPAFLATNVLGNDVQLTDVQNHPVIDPSANPPPELVLDPSADTATQLIVPLIEGEPGDQWQSVPLQPSTYQVSLEAGSTLEFLLAPADSPDWTSVDQNLAQFSVLGQGATLADAVDLETIGTSTRVVSGQLDPNDYRAAVDLYEFTLGPGPLRQVSLMVDTQNLSSLLPALSLFDAQGHVLETRNAGTGSLDNSNDPFLILGLQPGTYFVGVSGAGNLPNAPGGYDPITGTPGTVGRNQPGGPFSFQLDLLATPVVKSTSVVNFELQYADSLESSPTGLTLTFSGPIDLSPFLQPDQQQHALELVDSTGRTWPLMGARYDTAQDRLDLNLNEPLPVGTYSLVVPSQGGLTDLAGQPVVGPSGDAPGVLATWAVAPASAPSDPSNLGVIWPGTVNQTWSATTITRTTELAPAQETSVRFVTLFPGFYKLQDTVAQGRVAGLLEWTGGSLPLDLEGGNNDINIPTPGEYRLVLTSLGSQPASIQWTLKPAAVDWELIVYNGAGQSAALSLPPVAIAVTGPQEPIASNDVGPAPAPALTVTAAPALTVAAAPAPASAPEPSPSPAAADGRSSDVATAGAGLSSNAITVTAAPIPAGLLVSLNTGVVGLPSPSAQHVAVVGPTAAEGSIALADNAAGLLPGIRYQSVPNPVDRLGAGDPPVAPDATIVGPVVASEAVLPAPDGAAPRNGRDRADAQALAQADWLVRLAARLGDTIVPPTREEPLLLATTAAPTLVPTNLNPPAIPPSDSAGAPSANPWQSVVHADLGAPISLVVAVAFSHRLRRPLRKWWRRQDQTIPAAQQLPRFLGHGPHGGRFQPTPPRRSRQVCVPS